MKLLWQNSVDQRSIWRETAVDTSDTECKCNVKSMIWKENTVNNKALVWRFTNDFSTRLQNSETRSPGVFAVNVNLARGFFVWLCFYQPQRSRWWPSHHSSHSMCLADRVAQSRFFHFFVHPPSLQWCCQAFSSNVKPLKIETAWSGVWGILPFWLCVYTMWWHNTWTWFVYFDISVFNSHLQ